MSHETLDLTAKVVNIRVDRGQPLPIRITLTDVATGDPLDLTSCSAEWVFHLANGTSLLSLTSENGRLMLSDGVVTGQVSGDEVDDLKSPCRYFARMIWSDGRPQKVLGGVVQFLPE